MNPENRLPPLARAIRIVSVGFFFLFITSLVLVSCSREFKRRHRRTPDASSISRIAIIETAALRASHRKLRSIETQIREQEKHIQPVNVESTNLTVVLEHIGVNTANDTNLWMYTQSNSPFQEHINGSYPIYANSKFTWNDDGQGNGSCSSGGSGKRSRGYLDPFNYHLGLQVPPDFDNVTAELRNLSISDFLHINTVHQNSAWNVMGEAGDTRRYSHGTFKILSGSKLLLSARNVQWVQNLSYPSPIGESAEGTLSLGAYFVAEIQELKSDKNWVRRLDPNGVGFVLGIITAASLGQGNCFSSNSYWVSLRGFPDFSQEHTGETQAGFITGGQQTGAKVGNYKGSSDRDLKTARLLSNLGKGVVLSVIAATVGAAAASTVVSILNPSSAQAPPGQGLVRLIGTVAFVAKLNEIYGFHSDSMNEFSGGLRMFVGKVDWPWKDKSSSSSAVSRFMEEAGSFGHMMLDNSTKNVVSEVVRQENEESVTIVDEIFKNCSFYTTLIVLGFLSIHVFIWLLTRKREMKKQVVAHAWMVYLFSIIMAHVYRAAVLNSTQYLRSHVGSGSGKALLYLIAVMQLLIIGVGFTAFFITVMILALKRIRKREIEWIPKQLIADPEIRRSPFITGQYRTKNGNAFHSIFECYYTSLAGPRLWLAALELTIVFLDALCTALIWNEVVCLAILVCVYALLFSLFLLLAPFVDKVEGWLVVALGLVELILLIIDFIAALGDYDMAESMEFGAVILGFVAIILAVLIAIYCDLIPIVMSLWGVLMRRFRRKQGSENDCSTLGGSDWSGLSDTESHVLERDRAGDRACDSDIHLPRNKRGLRHTKQHDSIPLDALVAYNAAMEKEEDDTLSEIFKQNEGQRTFVGDSRIDGQINKGEGVLQVDTSADEFVSPEVMTTRNESNDGYGTENLAAPMESALQNTGDRRLSEKVEDAVGKG